MKKIALILSFVAFVAVSAQAQDGKTDNTPVWTISKGVQQLQFRNVTYLPAKITTTNQMIVSKGVHNVNKGAETKGQVAMNGYPSWTISKGAARFQYEAANKR